MFFNFPPVFSDLLLQVYADGLLKYDSVRAPGQFSLYLRNTNWVVHGSVCTEPHSPQPLLHDILTHANPAGLHLTRTEDYVSSIRISLILQTQALRP